MVVGDEVPHVHLHIVPFDSVSELSFAHADPNPPEGSLEAAAEKIRAALRAQLDPARAEHVSD
jgi:histidine triad (HIT) family protein